MERIEYRNVVDKSEWQRGEWDNEPDKIQWRDEETGLPCLIVRGPVGALCGYVGVPKSHPWHGMDYSQCTVNCQDDWCEHRPESKLGVHGGLTFAHGCSEISHEKWEDFRKGVLAGKKEAEQYPHGDAARRLKEWSDGLDDYDAWAKRAQASFICHYAPGEDDAWWFGFDCAHCDDMAPASTYRLGAARQEEYRNVAYVTEECRRLARQLHEIGK